MLIVGLGNPGSKYAKTRHNVGFMVIDKLIEKYNPHKVSSSSFEGELYKLDDTLFLKPLTYMNLSGKSVKKVKDFYKIDINDIIVIHDDLDLPFGAVKFKQGGGNGGHNGLKSIDESIGKDYIRVRIGISKPQRKSEVISYVLSDFSEEELDKLQEIIQHTCDALNVINKESLEIVKSKYTKKR